MPEMIPPPEHASPVPDKYTRKADYTGPSAEGRILQINFGFFKYGTNDQTHAAAMVISLLLLVFMAAILIFSPPGAGAEKTLGWLQSAFLLTVGVAIGKTRLGSRKEDD